MNALIQTGPKYHVDWLMAGSTDIDSYRIPSSSWTLPNEMRQRVTTITRNAGQIGQETSALYKLHCDDKFTRVTKN